MRDTPPAWSPYLYFGILLVVACALVYFVLQGAVGTKEVGVAFLATVGTFVGALFAFRLNENKEQRTVHKERRSALTRALFIVIRQYNAVRSLRNNLQPYRSEFERAFNCPAFRPPSYSDLTHDFDSLSFLLEAAAPTLVMRLLVEQEGFHQTMESLRVRNELYIDEVQPVIANHGFNHRSVPAEEFQRTLGERLFGTAINGATSFTHMSRSPTKACWKCTENSSKRPRSSTLTISSSSCPRRPDPSFQPTCLRQPMNSNVGPQPLDAIRHTGVTLVHEVCELEHREKYPSQGRTWRIF